MYEKVPFSTILDQHYAGLSQIITEQNSLGNLESKKE